MPRFLRRPYRYGIVAFLQKQSLTESALWDGIQQSFALDATRRAVNARRSEVNSRVASLTPGERAVLSLIMNGNNHASIADSLKMSRRTVENRMARVRDKLGVETLPEMMRLLAEAKGFEDASKT